MEGVSFVCVCFFFFFAGVCFVLFVYFFVCVVSNWS